MVPVSQILNNVLEAMHRTEDDKMTKRVWTIIRDEYLKLCREVSWANLRDMITIDFTSSTDAGMWLPSDLYGIDMVRDHEEGYEFVERNRSDVELDEYGYRYYKYPGSAIPLMQAEDLTLSSEQAQFASATATALVAAGTSVKDYYARFSAEPGIYKITADTLTISPTYYGPDLSEARIIIRPKETERMCILNSAEEILHDREVDIYYWKAPQPLYEKDDIICLPHPEVLELRVLRKLPEAKILRPVSQGEMDNALALCIKLNPDKPRSGRPRDKQNKLFSFGQNLYTDRGR